MRHAALIALALCLSFSSSPIGVAPAYAQADEDDGGTRAKNRARSMKKPTVSPRKPAGKTAPRKAETAKKDDSKEASDAEPTDEPWQGDGDSPAGAASAASAEKAPPKLKEPIPEDVRININYDDVELKDIIKDFAHKTGRNFLVDNGISGKITIHAPRAVTIDEAYEAFIVALDSAGYTTVVEARFKSGKNRGKPMLTRVLSASDARTEPLELYKAGKRIPTGAKLVTRLVELENIPADEVRQVIAGWISSNGTLQAYAPTNTLIITESANNIRRLLEMIRELDISAPQQQLEVIPIQYSEAAQVLTIIQEIYGADGTANKSSKGTTRSTKSKRNKGSSKSKKKSGGTGKSSTVGAESSFIGKMIADERTNSIIVLATEKSIAEIKDLIARVDYEVDPFAQADIQVMYLNHAKAEELSNTLNQLIQASNSRSSSGRSKSNTSKRGADGGKAGSKKKSLTGGKAGNLGGNFQGEVRLTHDAPTNSLVVTASHDDFLRLRKVVEQLDIPRKQVFVETVIMEVSDQTSKDNGVSWHGGGIASGDAGSASIIGARGGSSISPAGALLDGSLLAGLGLGIFGEALDIALPGVEGGLQIPAFGVVLRFLQEDSSTNVLSAPNILTLDNEEAEIEIGEQVPFPTGGFLGGLAGAATGATGLGGLGGLPSISFTRQDVGIILRVTPQISESEWVTLDVYQEISEVKEGSSSDSAASGGPTTTKRSAETHVSVRSNQTVVIGGLMQEVETESESKVPILGDIPLLGALFRNKRKTKRKTNLLIFLTPHVIDSPSDLQEIYRVKMLQREEFMRRFYGKSKAEQMAELDTLIRYSMNLPDRPSVYSDPAPAAARYNDKVRLEDEELLEVNEVQLEILDDEELLEAIENLEDTGDATLITPEGEVQLESSEDLDEASEDDSSSTAPSGEEEQ